MGLGRTGTGRLWGALPGSLYPGQAVVGGTGRHDAVDGGDPVEHVDDTLVIQEAGGLAGPLLLPRLRDACRERGILPYLSRNINSVLRIRIRTDPHL